MATIGPFLFIVYMWLLWGTVACFLAGRPDLLYLVVFPGMITGGFVVGRHGPERY